MIDLEERISTALETAADGITAQPLQPGRPRTLARRRRRNRNLGRVATIVVAFVGFGAALALVGAPGAEIQAAERDGRGADGIPLDTGPELQWQRQDTDLGLTDIIWSGERFVAAGSEDRTAIYASVDGREWELMVDELPGGLAVLGLTAGGDRLVAWGPQAADFPQHDGPTTATTRLAISDDHGSTWRDIGPVGTPQADDDPLDYVTRTEYVTSVAANRNTVVALTSDDLWPSVTEVLLDRGVIGPDDVVVTETMHLTDGSGAVEATYCVNPPANGCQDATESIEFEAPGLENSELGQGPTTVWTSVDGEPFEPRAQLDHEAFRIVVTQDRFIVLEWVDGGRLLGSDDGRTWTPIELDSQPFNLSGGGTDVVATSDTQDGMVVHRSTDGGRTWVRTQILTQGTGLSIGPGGQLVTGIAVQEQGSAFNDFVDWVWGRESPAPPIVLGWSADGQAWGWQSQLDAFGSEGWSRTMVGSETVVALVWPDEGDSFAATTPAVFVADVPS